jgi:hypothetical protein
MIQSVGIIFGNSFVSTLFILTCMVPGPGFIQYTGRLPIQKC